MDFFRSRMIFNFLKNLLFRFWAMANAAVHLNAQLLYIFLKTALSSSMSE